MLPKFLLGLPKPALFGLLGALGCMGGWLLGEPVLSQLKADAASGGQGARPTVLVFPNEYVQRQEREGAKSGDVQITLIWDNLNDLDLHCVNPAQDHIYFRNKKSAAGGELDVDMNARFPYTDKPVENVFFPTNGAPLGTYKVMVHHYAVHGAPDPTPYRVAIKANGKIAEHRGAISYGDPTNHVASFTVEPPKPTSSLLNSAVATKVEWKPVLLMGCWTALLATGLAFVLVVGQNALMRRQLLDQKTAWRLLQGGMLAGMASGALSQYLFAVGAQVLSIDNKSMNTVLKVGQVVGWMVLGGVLGAILSVFIPNLPKMKGGLAGLAGGFVGAAAFLLALALFGEVFGRLVGAAILGLAIGGMVAIVESMAREAALVVHWDEHERTVINLGEDPVILGSSPEAHLYLPAEKGFPAQTAIVTFKDGRVEFENLMTETSHTLHNGSRLQIGDLVVEIQTDA